MLFQLTLHGNEVADLGPLVHLTSLRVLLVGHNNIVDLAPLAGLTSLRRLDLGYNEIADLGALGSLTSLEHLTLKGNQIEDLDALARLTSLSYLDLSNTSTSDVAPLVWNGGLGLRDIVDLRANPLERTSLNDHIPTLRRRGVVVRDDDDETAVDIPDSALREAVEGALVKLSWGRSPGDRITRRDMLNVTQLSAKEVRQLDGIEYAYLIESLRLSEGYIGKLDALGDLGLLRELQLNDNEIEDISPLVANDELGDGDTIDLRRNPLSRTSLVSHVRVLRDRGVKVKVYDELAQTEIPDPGLRRSIRYWNGAGLVFLDASNFGIQDLVGVNSSSPLNIDLSGNKIADLTPLIDLEPLFLGLDYNELVDNWDVLEGVRLRNAAHLSLVGNGLRELPRLSTHLFALFLADNAITSLAPLEKKRLFHLDVNDNQIGDISALNVGSLREFYVRNNSVRDISALLDAERLLVLDVRGNPLVDSAMGVIGAPARTRRDGAGR